MAILANQDEEQTSASPFTSLVQSLSSTGGDNTVAPAGSSATASADKATAGNNGFYDYGNILNQNKNVDSSKILGRVQGEGDAYQGELDNAYNTWSEKALPLANREDKGVTINEMPSYADASTGTGSNYAKYTNHLKQLGSQAGINSYLNEMDPTESAGERMFDSYVYGNNDGFKNSLAGMNSRSFNNHGAERAAITSKFNPTPNQGPSQFALQALLRGIDSAGAQGITTNAANAAASRAMYQSMLDGPPPIASQTVDNTTPFTAPAAAAPAATADAPATASYLGGFTPPAYVDPAIAAKAEADAKAEEDAKNQQNNNDRRDGGEAGGGRAKGGMIQKLAEGGEPTTKPNVPYLDLNKYLSKEAPERQQLEDDYRAFRDATIDGGRRSMQFIDRNTKDLQNTIREGRDVMDRINSSGQPLEPTMLDKFTGALGQGAKMAGDGITQVLPDDAANMLRQGKSVVRNNMPEMPQGSVEDNLLNLLRKGLTVGKNGVNTLQEQLPQGDPLDQITNLLRKGRALGKNALGNGLEENEGYSEGGRVYNRDDHGRFAEIISSEKALYDGSKGHPVDKAFANAAAHFPGIKSAASLLDKSQHGHVNAASLAEHAYKTAIEAGEDSKKAYVYARQVGNRFARAHDVAVAPNKSTFARMNDAHPSSNPFGVSKKYAGGGKLGCAPGYADGGMQEGFAGMLKGPGTGQSDDMPAVGPNGAPISLSDGEYVLPAQVVSALGSGSSDAGGRMLDSFVKKMYEFTSNGKNQMKPFDFSDLVGTLSDSKNSKRG